MTIVNMTGGGGGSSEITTVDYVGYITLNAVSCSSVTSTSYASVQFTNVGNSPDSRNFDASTTITYAPGVLSYGGQRPIYGAYVAHTILGEKEYMAVTSANATSTVADSHGLDEILKKACPEGKTFTATLYGYVGNIYSGNLRIGSMYQSATTTTTGYRQYLGPLISGYGGSFVVEVTGDVSTCDFPSMPAATCSAIDFYSNTGVPSTLTPEFIIVAIKYVVS